MRLIPILFIVASCVGIIPGLDVSLASASSHGGGDAGSSAGVPGQPAAQTGPATGQLRTAAGSQFTLDQTATAPAQSDSVLDGLLIGAGVGALLGLIPDYYDDCEECHDSLYGSIAVGAGVGVLVDLLRRPRAARTTSISHRVALGIAGGRKGVTVRARFGWR